MRPAAHLPRRNPSSTGLMFPALQGPRTDDDLEVGGIREGLSESSLKKMLETPVEAISDSSVWLLPAAQVAEGLCPAAPAEAAKEAADAVGKTGQCSSQSH